MSNDLRKEIGNLSKLGSLSKGKLRTLVIALLVVALAGFVGCEAVSTDDLFGTSTTSGASRSGVGSTGTESVTTVPLGASAVTAEDIVPYSGEGYYVVNGNEPSFTDEDRARGAFEDYSPLDRLGRCGAAFACVGKETMPREGRGNISAVHPSGWKQRTYDFIDEDGKLYNRSHLIAHALAGEDDNELNLITGTHYLNQDVMVDFENQILSYVRKTGNHVLYRVTPVFEGNDLVARGVQMEAESVEDKGRGIKFNVFVHNVQPGVEIDYATGDSWLS